MKPPKAFVKKVGDELTTKVMKIPVLEKGQVLPRGKKSESKRNTIGERFRNNVYRAKRTVYELVMCNEWEWYGTVTIDDDKWNRNDLGVIEKAFVDWLRNTATKLNCKILRVIVPEQHSHGGWHFHFVLIGLSVGELQAFTLEQKLPQNIRIKLQNGDEVFNWPACAEKFGFCQLEHIGKRGKDRKAVANYMRNAIDSRDFKNGAHLYSPSNGLKRAELIAEGYACRDLTGDGVYEDGYIKTKKFGLDQLSEALSYVRQASVTGAAGDSMEKSGDDVGNNQPPPIG